MRKMVMVVVPRAQADRVMDALITAGYSATFTESRGGMLRQAQIMMFIAAKAEKVEDVLNIIRNYCHTKVEVGGDAASYDSSLDRKQPATAEVGWATVFVWDLEQFGTY
ncbi:MAG: cyclic-di-AMP receptor [Anaerolineae bacterium]|nr:cyclic-di-AMP receptor [Anaerolineae bacterium]